MGPERAIGRTAGIVLAGTLAVAGCSANTEATTLPTPTTDASPSPSPSESPADSPLASTSAEGESDTAATLALEDYFASANAVARGADPSAHQKLYAASCLACVEATADFLRAQELGLAADADRYDSWSLDTTASEASESEQVVISSSIDVAAVNLADAQGNFVEAVPAWKDAPFIWTMRRQTDGSWLIVQGLQIQ